MEEDNDDDNDDDDDDDDDDLFQGGMKAVIWTDVFQGTVLVAGLVAILIAARILQSKKAVT